jgi:hypothetical protein
MDRSTITLRINAMSVQKLRIKKGFSYTSVSNKVIQNLKNYEALGLYAYLLSLPEDWIFYKKQLAEHSGIGREKINTLLKILNAHNLIEYAQVRNQSGRFAQLDLHVKDGTEFKINNLQDCAPLTEKPSTDNRLPVNSTYIENNNKVNINTNKTSKRLCASDDALKSFDQFWNIYPRKKDKQRALKIWIDTNCHEKAEIIIKQLGMQILNDSQWKTIQYIPHPTTYLRNARWEDEITLERMSDRKESGMERAARLCLN